MTTEEFEGLLKSHDWYYEMSEDYSVYKRGLYKHQKLQEIAGKNPIFKKMFDEYAKLKYSVLK